MTGDNRYSIDLSIRYDGSYSLTDAFVKFLYHYTGEIPSIESWNKLELILKEEYHATVIHAPGYWVSICFDTEEELVAFKLKWL